MEVEQQVLVEQAGEPAQEEAGSALYLGEPAEEQPGQQIWECLEQTAEV